MVSKLAKALLAALVIIFITVALLIFSEGLSSAILFVADIAGDKRAPMVERKHTEYDRDLGWINIPNTHVEDMYGPGIHVKTNGDALRNDYDFTEKVSEGKVRLVCSGDSFTFGYGVSNEDTWCEKLESEDPRLETLNMAQGGYGLDQAYLWYKRDGGRFEHSIHIFAFVTTDFVRMQRDVFHGYGKPVLKLKNGSLLTANVPVPKLAYRSTFLTHNLKYIKELSIVGVIDKFRSKEDGAAVSNEDTYKVALALFDDLKSLNMERGSVVVVVYLPTSIDYNADFSRSALATELPKQLNKRGIHFINLIDEIKKYRPDVVRSFFIPKGKVDYASAAGHYTKAGNEFIADAIYRELVDRGLLP